MTHKCLTGLACAALLTVLGFMPVVSGAADTDTALYQVVDGVAIYFGLIPAEMIRGHPKAHPESHMHGGIPTDRYYHLTVAIFDDTSGERITGAEVTARVVGKGESGPSKLLEPMIIGGSRSYGNYFRMPGDSPYRIELKIHHPEISRVIRATFEWGRS